MHRPTRRTALALAAAPLILSARAKGGNDRVRISVIGAGNRSGMLIDQLPEGAEAGSIA